MPLQPNWPSGCTRMSRSTGNDAGLTGHPFWEAPLSSLDRVQWEALCDGCGQCCLHKVEDADTGEVYHTNVACKLLDLKTARCTDYAHRKRFVPDCLSLDPRNVESFSWLPESCAYRLRAAGQPLPEWHYLVCGDRDAVHQAAYSVAGKVVCETLAGPLEHHIVWPHGEDDDDFQTDGDPWDILPDEEDRIG